MRHTAAIVLVCALVIILLDSKYHFKLPSNEHVSGVVSLGHRTAHALQNHNVHFFAQSGTLLGGIRDGGMIPWDDDIDIGYTLAEEESVSAALRELEERFPSLYRVADVRDKPHFVGYQVYIKHSPVHIDLFRWRFNNDRWQMDSSLFPEEVIYRETASQDIASSVEKCVVSHRLHLPSILHPDEYLTTTYGNWRTPTMWNHSGWKMPWQSQDVMEQGGQKDTFFSVYVVDTFATDDIEWKNRLAIAQHMKSSHGLIRALVFGSTDTSSAVKARVRETGLVQAVDICTNEDDLYTRLAKDIYGGYAIISSLYDGPNLEPYVKVVTL